jgi:glycosyltransferase involved in cell wall biosynthesis
MELMPMSGRSAHLTVLLPVRNAAHLLPEWLESVGGYAETVIALDDGSTDGSAAILEAHPLVTCVLRNPPRATYHGWDDLGNRQRLIWAALAEGCEWMLFLDADERLAGDDAKALRQLVEIEAQPGHAYGFEVFRMVDDERHYDPAAFWVFRLFHATDAQSPLGSQRLHFVPVPSAIERNRWLYTSVRIQHFGSLTTDHRRARFDKYLEADPLSENQEDYTNLLDNPDRVWSWPARDTATAPLIGSKGRYLDYEDELSPLRPAWTAVVIARNDQDLIDRALQALENQELDDDLEVIVVCSGTDETADRARARGARTIQLPGRALPGEARNAGLWAANGEYITFPGSHVWVLPGSLTARLAAHDAGWDMVTTAVVNGNTTAAGWASYLLDHAAQTPAAPSGKYVGVPGHVSYVTDQVRDIGGFPEDMRAGEDTVVNRTLTLAGKRSYLCTDAAFVHASQSTTVRHLVAHHFQRGRGLGRIIKGQRPRATMSQLRQNLDLPKRRLQHIQSGVERTKDPELSRRLASVEPLVRIGALAASVGCWFELMRTTPLEGPSRYAAEPPAQRRADAPWLLVGGRPGEAARGLLAAGSPTDAINHLATLTKYAETVRPVRPALGLIATSATITAESGGTYTIDIPDHVVSTYSSMARRAGVGLWLVLQPGRSSLPELVARWADHLVDTHTGVLFDLHASYTPAGGLDVSDLVEVGYLIREQFGHAKPVGVVGVGALRDLDLADIISGDVMSLRAGAVYPHTALTDGSPSLLLYL